MASRPSVHLAGEARTVATTTSIPPTVFMINQLPLRTDIASKFHTLVYQALVDVTPRPNWVSRAVVPR